MSKNYTKELYRNPFITVSNLTDGQTDRQTHKDNTKRIFGNIDKLEGAHNSAYLCQVKFYKIAI